MVKGTVIFYYSLGFPDESTEADTRCRCIVVPRHRAGQGFEQFTEVLFEVQGTDRAGDPRWCDGGTPHGGGFGGGSSLLTELFRLVTIGKDEGREGCIVTETAHGVRSIDLGRILVPRSV
jgi:hypothetical protein